MHIRRYYQGVRDFPRISLLGLTVGLEGALCSRLFEKSRTTRRRTANGRGATRPRLAEINRNRQQTYRLLALGAIKSAKKYGRRWAADRNALRREFGALSVGRDVEEATS
jgi:hypothetical protein